MRAGPPQCFHGFVPLKQPPTSQRHRLPNGFVPSNLHAGLCGIGLSACGFVLTTAGFVPSKSIAEANGFVPSNLRTLDSVA